MNSFWFVKNVVAPTATRPSYGYLNLSAGLDVGTKLFANTNLEEVLRGELSKRSYVCKPINIGNNTNLYQPTEKKSRLTRAALALLNECSHPCTIATKNTMIERDLDILVPQINGGKDYDSNFATRMRGQGVFADIIRKLVQVATRKAGMDRAWDTARVFPPQGELF